MPRFIVALATFWFSSLVSPQSIAKEPSIERGAVLRLVIFHHDGFGDLQNAIALARALRRTWPDADFPIVVEDRRAYERLSVLSGRPVRGEEAIVMEDQDILLGRSGRAAAALRAHPWQIVFLPAGNERTKMVWGTGRYNIYVEEPGVPASEMKYVELSRGVAQRRGDGSLHVRINPGFGDSAFGLAPPAPPAAREPRDRDSLLEALRAEGFALDPILRRAKWATVYNHSEHGNDGRFFYEALAFGIYFGQLREDVAVFDFGSGASDLSYLRGILGKRRRFWSPKARLEILRRGDSIDPRPGRGRTLSVVKVGPVPRALYLDFLARSDLPAAVTGTQSLLEVLARPKPFAYEFIAWKMDLNFGLAEVVLRDYEGEDRRFLLDWILGEGDQIHSVEDLVRRREAFQSMEVTRDADQVLRHRLALFELVTSGERRALITDLITKLESEFELANRLRACATALEHGE